MPSKIYLMIVLCMLLPLSAFSATYYDCIRSDGSITFRAEPCLKQEKESRHFQVNLDDFDQTKKESVGRASPNPVSLRQESNGNYLVSGSVNGYPVNFIVDTGASLTTISKQTATAAGIPSSCTPRSFHTANGEVIGCVVTIREVTFDKFRLVNVDVAVMPNMQGALLGMNVLGQFKMQQQGNVMKISD